MNSIPAVLPSISSTMATGPCAPAACAQPTAAQQYASVANAIFICKIPHPAFPEEEVFFSLSHEAAHKTCRRAFLGQLTSVGDGRQGKERRATFAARAYGGHLRGRNGPV